MPDEGRPDRDPRGPFIVDPAPARDRRRSALPVALLGVVTTVVVGLTAWGILVPQPPAPTAPRHTARPSTALESAAPSSGVPDAAGPARDDGPVLAQLARRAGWEDCPIWRGFGGSPGVGPDLVAAARAEQGIATGRLEVDDPRGGMTAVWLGDDGGAAARGLGGTFVVRAGDFVWAAVAEGSDPPVAIRLDAGGLDDGTVYWQERARAVPAPYCLEDATGQPARVVEVGPGTDALARLMAEMRIDGCRTWQHMETAGSAAGRDVDQAMDLLGVPLDGAAWVGLPVQPGYGEPQVRTWVGRDPAEAGARHGSDLVVLQPGDPADADPAGWAWMAVRLDGRPAAIQLRVVETPAGRRAWVPTPNAAGTIGTCQIARTGAP